MINTWSRYCLNMAHIWSPTKCMYTSTFRPWGPYKPPPQNASMQANMAWVSSCSNVEKYAPEKSRRKMSSHESKYAAEPSKKVWWLDTITRSMSLRQSSSTAKGKSNGEMRARGHFIVARKKLGKADGCIVGFSLAHKRALAKKVASYPVTFTM